MSLKPALAPLFTLLLAFTLSGAAAIAQEQTESENPPAQTQQVRQIEKALLVRLVRSTLSAVDHANSTGNYTVLRDLAAPSFAARNSAATLAIEFKPLRDARVDLSPVLVLPIALSRAPTLDEAGRLDIAGSVAGQPLTVAFWMRFEPVNGFLRLLDLNINLVETEAAAGNATQNPQATETASEENSGEIPDAGDDGVRASTSGRVPVPSPKPGTADE